MGAVTTSLEAGLARGADGLRDLAASATARGRTDVSALPSSALALLLSRLEGASVVVVADTDAARALADDLRFFGLDAGSVLVFPAADTSPFVDVAPDRRAAMERLATLFHLAEGLPFRALVVAAPALLRRVPPRDAIAARSKLVRAEDELEREPFLRLLVSGGYLRVPVVEDAGTFAVRGALVDVFPPHARRPVRIELDDWLVTSIKSFDPDDQRTTGDVREVFVHPVRDALYGPAEMARAREVVRSLAEHVDMPTSRTRQLLDDLESGRELLGLEGLVPAFYDGMGTLWDYLPASARVVVVDPTAVVKAASEELAQAERDRDAKVADRAPVFPLDAHYDSEEGVAARLAAAPSLLVVHRVAMAGALTEEETSPLAALETVAQGAVRSAGGEDQSGLALEIKLARARSNAEDHLAPLARRTKAWLAESFRVLFTARTATQADRLAQLLRGDAIPLAGKPQPFAPALLDGLAPGTAAVAVGALAHGFVLPREALVVVTDEEIFGTRAASRGKRDSGSKKRRRTAEPFLEDLRQLEVGDYVVHEDHGIGRYLGLERKTMPRSKLDELRGTPVLSVEVLIVEYAGGDKLFLPVTRLAQLSKFRGGEGSAPRLDRLGGQTFEKTKSKVRRAVQQLADELLRLYAERQKSRREPLAPPDRTYDELCATFAFEETPDQSRAIDEVLTDLEGARPMDRIVCGDVGFGKTEVALRAAFRVAMSGKQVAVLCPTTVLAQQHFQTFRDRFREWPLRVETLSRFVDKKDQAEVLAAAKEGKVDVIVGTHRLLSKDVHFARLGLVVVDEEQRFGVTHKERLKKLKSDVDVLTLSATPIPRTLQLAVGGLRDLSLITTPPVDRRAIRTFVTRWDDHLVKEAVERELTRGGQVFFVYNRIEGLYERAHRLQELVPHAKIAVAHGQMAEHTLERAMTDFVEGRFDVLCSTAIVESGLDIPRANTMLIDRADTFGLAQLYQLRGRVGRSRERAYCYLIAPPPSQLTDDARARIEALERFTELGAGFQVASLDMELRGAGDLLGAEQSGQVASVGLDMFVHMLGEAVAELRGDPVVHDVDPELTFDLELFLPEQYVDDVGLRLSLYKRFASAEDEDEVQELAREMEDRFGPPPDPALAFVRAMSLKPALRALRVLGCEATRDRVTLHLREDTPLDPAKVLALATRRDVAWKLSPDMKLTRRFDAARDEGDVIDHVRDVLRALEGARKDDA